MSDRPDFLVIMTEQHRADCLGIAGHPCLLTPNMDAIGYGGAHFTRAYATCPTCIAARRSFLSGQFPSTHGMVGYCDGVEWDAPTTVAAALGRAGYQTTWIGRSMHQHPPHKRYGFDHVDPDEDYDAWLASHVPGGGADLFSAGPMHNDWTARPWPFEENLHFTKWTTDRALKFLRRRDPSCPFFAVVSYHAAHPPLTPPAFYLERYLRADIPGPVIGQWETPPDESWRAEGAGGMDVNLQGEALRCCRAGYYGLINHVDDQLRRLLNPITGVGAMTGGNTVVIFCSDHGEMLGDHYRYHKVVPYEASASIPLMISHPELPGGVRCDLPVCLEDIMPTVLELAGVDCPQSVEGRSLVPMLHGRTPDDWRDCLHIEHASLHQSLTDGREKYIWFVADGREQFFDLSEDPSECRDLIDSPAHAERVGLWRGRLIDTLRGRPEGFTDGEKLIPGRPYGPVMPARAGRARE